MDKNTSPDLKFDQGKSRVDLIEPGFLLSMGDVLGYGAEKYEEESWKEVPRGEDRYYAAAMRHLLAMRSGELTDPESGLPHIAHAACNIMFLQYMQELKNV